jgi:hypothetical protein
MKILCIDDTNRPETIPTSKWLKKNQEYTPTGVIKCNSQGGIFGFILAEIDLKGCEPYKCFSIHRFAIPVEIKEEVEELEEVLV